MLGQKLDIEHREMSNPAKSHAVTPRLCVRSLAAKPSFNDISFDLFPGEVLGVVALEGQGQDALFDVLSGFERPSSGTITLDGEPASFAHPADAIAAGFTVGTAALKEDFPAEGPGFTEQVRTILAITARAQARAAALVIATDIHPVNNLRVVARLGQLGLDAAVRTAWMNDWMTRGFTAFEQLISSDSPFCFGKQPGLADLCLVPQLYNAHRWGCDLAPFPRLTEIESRCLAHAAFDAARPENQPDAT